jgi:hypothetical protein
MMTPPTGEEGEYAAVLEGTDARTFAKFIKQVTTNSYPTGDVKRNTCSPKTENSSTTEVPTTDSSRNAPPKMPPSGDEVTSLIMQYFKTKAEAWFCEMHQRLMVAGKHTLQRKLPLNINPLDDHSEVFLSHARLYVRAVKYAIAGLPPETLVRLSLCLKDFILWPKHIVDIVKLICYSYENSCPGGVSSPGSC